MACATFAMRSKSMIARVGAGADDDQLRRVLVRQALELVVVESLVVFAHAVGHDLVELAREVERMAVREVAAVGEVHAEDGVARLQVRQHHGHVGLRARVRLDVGVLGAEQVVGALDRQRLGHVDELAAAVVALARVALGVLVGHHRPRGRHHGGAREVLRGDELEAVVLAGGLVGDRLGDVGVDLGQGPQVQGCEVIHRCRNLRATRVRSCSSAAILSMRR